MRQARLIVILLFAAMFLVLSFLVASVTSCSPVPTTAVQPVPTAQPIIEDGTIYHPYRVDPSPFATPVDTWSVLTVKGHEHWSLNWIYDARGKIVLRIGDYILHDGDEYQLSQVDQQHLTMGAVIMGN